MSQVGTKRILLIQGHPDASEPHLCHALASSYSAGAESAGHSIKSLERNLLGIVGIAPVHETLIGLAGNMKPVDAEKWLNKLKRLGERAE